MPLSPSPPSPLPTSRLPSNFCRMPAPRLDAWMGSTAFNHDRLTSRPEALTFLLHIGRKAPQEPPRGLDASKPHLAAHRALRLAPQQQV